MAPRHENRGKETANTRGGSVKGIGSASRESDLGISYKLNAAREIHGVDRVVECRVIQTRTVDPHVRLSVGKNESGRGTVNVRQRRNGRGSCR